MVAVDERAEADVVAALHAVADRLIRYPYAEPVERPRPWLHRQCSGTWLLTIDDDEIPSAALLEALPSLVQARDVTHYWLPRRWLFPSSGQFLDEPPWRPDYQLRLLLNDIRLLRFPGELHWSLMVLGPGRYLELPVYHVDLVVNSLSARREKAARYERILPGLRIAGRPFNEAFYVPEDAGELTLTPVAKVDLDLIGACLDRAPAPGRPVSGFHEASRAEIDRYWPSRSLRESDYRARLEIVGNLQSIATDEVQTLAVRITNLGETTWPFGTGIPPEIRVSYRWWSADQVVGEGLRSPLPADVGPGMTCLVPVAVKSPAVPGSYRLAVDLVNEHVRWFDCSVSVESEVHARQRLAIVAHTGRAVQAASAFRGEVILLVPDPERLRDRWKGESAPSLDAYLLDGLPASRSRAAAVLVARAARVLLSALRMRSGREPRVAQDALSAVASCDSLLILGRGERRRERAVALITRLTARILAVSKRDL